MNGSWPLYTHIALVEYTDGQKEQHSRKKKKKERGRVPVQTLLQAKDSQEVTQTRADMDKPEEQVMCYFKLQT